MTRDDIIRMAKKAELQCYMNLTEHSLAIEDLEHFAALVRDNYNNKHSQLWQVCVEEMVEAEREACAKAAGPEDSYRDEWFNAKADSVKRILARSNT